MAKLTDWKIYYDNGSIFTSSEGSWENAPSDGIQVLVEYYDDKTKKIHIERDYYILDDGKAYGTNNINPWLRKNGIVKFGRWSSDDKFQALIKKAKDDILNDNNAL